MYAEDSKAKVFRIGERVSADASRDLRVAVTFPAPHGGLGLTRFNPPLSTASVKRFLPDPLAMDQAIYQLSKMGLQLTRRGPLSASMRCKLETYEKVFGTQLTRIEFTNPGYSHDCVFFPREGSPWNPNPEIATLIDDAYIQWPHIYLAEKPAPPAIAPQNLPSAFPPKLSNFYVPNKFYLEVPGDVASLLNADMVHRAGSTGKGIRVVMVDSGFAHTQHPFFASHHYRSTVDLAPSAINDATDPDGHGTGQSANLFAVAPDATFIGVKLDNDDDRDRGASLLEGFQTALQHQPHIITISNCYNLRNQVDARQMSELPSGLAALEAEVQNAISNGVIVVFAAGNGQFAFPGMMRDVISAGGVYVDGSGNMQASNFASSFASKIYAGRHVPDFSGLVGLLPHASYIMLPVPVRSRIDRNLASPPDPPGDGTRDDDGWAVFSGTSAAAPQLAGVCALLLEKNPGLTPSDMKAILRRTARTVLRGNANPASSDDGVPVQASSGDSGAAGAGLIDAFAAWQQT